MLVVSEKARIGFGRREQSIEVEDGPDVDGARVVRRVSDGATWLVADQKLRWPPKYSNLLVDKAPAVGEPGRKLLLLRSGRTPRGNAKPRAPSKGEELEVPSAEGLLPLALAATSDASALPTLGDLVLERGWRSAWVEDAFGRGTRRRRWHRRKGNAARPTRAWARQVAIALVFEGRDWDASWGPSAIRRSLEERMREWTGMGLLAGAMGHMDPYVASIVSQMEASERQAVDQLARIMPDRAEGEDLRRLARMYGIEPIVNVPSDGGPYRMGGRAAETGDELRERLTQVLRNPPMGGRRIENMIVDDPPFDHLGCEDSASSRTR